MRNTRDGVGKRTDCSWAIVAIERCGALATGFPGGISDNDVVTPFPRPFADIASVRRSG
jgi:hypothetical protein